MLVAPPAGAAIGDVQALIAKGRYAAAVEAADADLASTPKDPQTRFLKGIALAELNRADDAIAVFRQLTEDYPELPEPYNNLAVLYAQQRQFEKAKGALEMAIRTHPSYATAHENLGDVYARLASDAYNKALQLDSANVAAQSKLALIRELMTVSARNGAPEMVAAAPAAPEPVAPLAPRAAPAEPVAPVARPQPAPEPQVAEPQPTPQPPVAEPQPAPEPAAERTPPSATPPSQVAVAAPSPQAPKPQPAAKDDAVRAAVEDWARAWSEKDMTAYLGAYAADFDPPRGKSREAWEAERKRRVDGKPGDIEVSIEDVRITVAGDAASATFRQHYRSSGFNGSTDKTLRMVYRDGKWRIREELIGRQ